MFEMIDKIMKGAGYRREVHLIAGKPNVVFHRGMTEVPLEYAKEIIKKSITEFHNAKKGSKIK